MNYAKAIRTVRAARGLDQRQLAELAGVDASCVSLVERGLRVPSLTLLERMALVLSCPVMLLCLLASSADELKGLTEKQAQVLGAALLKTLVKR